MYWYIMLTITLDGFDDDIDNVDSAVQEITLIIKQMYRDIKNLPTTLNKVILSFENDLFFTDRYSFNVPNEEHIVHYIKLPFGCKLYVQKKDGTHEITNFSGYIYERLKYVCIDRYGNIHYTNILKINLNF